MGIGSTKGASTSSVKATMSQNSSTESSPGLQQKQQQQQQAAIGTISIVIPFATLAILSISITNKIIVIIINNNSSSTDEEPRLAVIS